MGHRHLREPDGHLADGAFPGWGQTGCCRGERPAARRGPRGPRGDRCGVRGSRGRFAACPGSAQTGCCRGEELQDGAQDGSHRHHRVPQAPQQRQPWQQQSWEPRSPGRRQTVEKPAWGQAWESPDGKELPVRSQQPRQRRREPRAPAREEQSGPLGGPRPRQRQAWLPTSLRWARPLCHRQRDRRRRPALRGTSRESCGRRGARWSKMPTGRTRPVLSNG